MLGLSCEFTEYSDADVCVCTFVGCVAQRSDVSDASSSASSDHDKEYEIEELEMQMAMEQEFAGFDSSDSPDSVEIDALFEHQAMSPYF